MLIGRQVEKALLGELIASSNAELLALYGRRRVGKTYLIRSFFAEQLAFELTGLHDAPMVQQLDNFVFSLSQTFTKGIAIPRPANWLVAFQLLIQFLEANPTTENRCFFLMNYPGSIHRNRVLCPHSTSFGTVGRSGKPG